MLQDVIGRLLAGDRDGTMLWKILLEDIEYEPITEPAEGVFVASLAESILRCGQLQPILVCRRENNHSQGKYRLIAGRRRLEAMRMLGRTHIHAMVIRCETERIGALSLAENLIRRDPCYIELAEQVQRLIKAGWKADKLAAMLSMPVLELESLLELLTLPSYELRMLRLCPIQREDAVRLLKITPSLRRTLLEKCAAASGAEASALIKAALENPAPKLTQTRKIMVSSARAFLNTVERAAQTMRSAGYDVAVSRDESNEEYTFEIRVAKCQGAKLRELDRSADVSRETCKNDMPSKRFSSAASIFEALAEEECAIGGNVSRETFMNGLSVSRENAEKLELCIDGCEKK